MATRVILLIALSAFLFSGIVLADDGKIVVADVESFEQGKLISLEWSAPNSKLSSLSAWNLNSGKFPLSTEDAIKIARTRLIKAFPAVKGWKLDEISLREILNNGRFVPCINGKYYYLVHLLPSRDEEAKEIEKSETGEMSFYDVILSDGTALEPTEKIGNN